MQSSQIGEKIGNLRKKRGLSVAEVAEKTGISTTELQEIENQEASPPLGHIILLAKTLKVAVGDLFGDSADSPFCLVRHEEQATVPRFSSAGGKSGGYSYKSLGSQKQNRHMEPFLVTLNPTDTAALQPNQHDGEEILFVLEGKVEIRLGEHTDLLKPGDSIYFDSSLPHVVRCHGGVPAKIFTVIYTEKEMMIL